MMTLLNQLQQRLDDKIKQFEEERTEVLKLAASTNSLEEFKQSLGQLRMMTLPN
jgi:hypothetical protein